MYSDGVQVARSQGEGVTPLLSAMSLSYIYIFIEDFIIFYYSLKSIYTLQTP